VTPFGISRDSAWSHRAWREALDLDIALLSDWNGEAVRAFDIGFTFNGLEDLAGRSAFLVDRDGIIRGAWRYELGEPPDFDALLEAARALRSAS